MTRPRPISNGGGPRNTGWSRWFLAAGAGAGAALVLVAALFREDPMFWRNAGGYPVWLRELVLIGFGPLVVAEYGLLLLATGLFVGRPPRSLRGWWMESGFLALAWSLAVVAVLIVVANNVGNLIDGRPLHFHPEVRLPLPLPAACRE